MVVKQATNNVLIVTKHKLAVSRSLPVTEGGCVIGIVLFPQPIPFPPKTAQSVSKAGLLSSDQSQSVLFSTAKEATTAGILLEIDCGLQSLEISLTTSQIL
jgi:hypothetical protein